MLSKSLTAIACTLLATSASAQLTASRSVSPQPPASNTVIQLEDGTILAADVTGTYTFDTWSDYAGSPFFERNNKRCNAVGPELLQGNPADCNNSNTSVLPQYEAQGGALFQIPVVWHVLYANNGTGNIPDSAIYSQMDILNEDFRAIAGSLGGNGTDCRIEFVMATTDPNGNPSTGITRHKSNKWYNDGSGYTSVRWDTNRYLNIYTNTAGGNLGYAYVPSGGGVVGSSFDGVRMLWSTIGANAPIGAPYNLGRTVTHEVGHYLGLYHTFQGGCASQSGCSNNGDLICDTNPEGSPNYSPCSRSSCGSPDPTNNYMDYSDDICMTEFTPNQANRMRCTLENFRVDLGSTGGPTNTAPTVSIDSPSNGTSVSDGTPINFSGSASDAEDGNLSGAISWSSNLDGGLGSGASVNATLSVGTHTITASVSDSGGASDSDSISVTVTGTGGGLSLSTNGYKVKGKQTIDLSWSGASTANVDVYRDGALIATVANDGAWTHATTIKGGGSYDYQVCETGGGACSNVSTVNF